MEKSELQDLLRANVVEVTFTKVNGDQRVMTSTLMESKLPPREPEAGERVKKENPAVLAVWDINQQDWRSFRVQNVSSVKIVAS